MTVPFDAALFELQQRPWLFTMVAALLGLMIGSFLNVVVHRLPRMMERQWNKECREYLGLEPEPGDPEPYNLMRPGSQCPSCRTPVHPLHNVPVLSYLCLRGRCAHCATAISVRYPLIEAATGLLSAAVGWHFGFGWQALWALLFTWALFAAAAIDLEHQLLPDAITLPLLWLGLLLSLAGAFVNSHDAILGAAAGYLSLWAVYHLFRLATGKEGMGHGDFKLLAALGAWGGWKILPTVILLSSLVGTVVGIGLIAFGGRDRSVPMPFGPFLAAAGWIALLWGDWLASFYLG